jgi:hypothetical protein
VFALIVLAGSGRTYYLNGYVCDASAGVDAGAHARALMTAWVPLFAVPAWFIPSKRIALDQPFSVQSFGDILETGRVSERKS